MMRRHGSFAYVACLMTLAFVPIHIVWAAGGTLLLPGGEHTTAVAGLRAVNIVVSCLLVFGSIIVLGLARPWGRALHPAVLLVPVGVASVICLSHAAFGFITKSLYAAGVHEAVHFPDASWTEADRMRATLLDLALFEPWFLAEGALLAAAGRDFIRTRTGRRQWIVAIMTGTILIAILGWILSFNGLHLAIH